MSSYTISRAWQNSSVMSERTSILFTAAIGQPRASVECGQHLVQILARAGYRVNRIFLAFAREKRIDRHKAFFIFLTRCIVFVDEGHVLVSFVVARCHHSKSLAGMMVL